MLSTVPGPLCFSWLPPSLPSNIQIPSPIFSLSSMPRQLQSTLNISLPSVSPTKSNTPLANAPLLVHISQLSKTLTDFLFPTAASFSSMPQTSRVQHMPTNSVLHYSVYILMQAATEEENQNLLGVGMGGLTRWSSDKESAFQRRGCRFDPWSGN